MTVRNNPLGQRSRIIISLQHHSNTHLVQSTGSLLANYSPVVLTALPCKDSKSALHNSLSFNILFEGGAKAVQVAQNNT